MTNADSEKQDLVRELRDLYCKANPNSNAFDVFLDAQCPETAIEEVLAIDCHCFERSDAIDFFIERYKCSGNEKLPRALEEILAYATEPSDSTAYTFVSKLATLHLRCYSYIHKDRYEYAKLPKASRTGTSIVDLASGYDFINFLPHVSVGTLYYPIDNSFFVTEVIRQKADALNLENVHPVRKNVLELQREDFSVNDIEIIRGKNVFSYVPNYLDVLNQHLDWLCDGGRFVFSEESANRTVNLNFFRKAMSLCVRLINEGWGLNYEFGDLENPMALNSICFEKGGGAGIQGEMEKLGPLLSEVARIYKCDPVDFIQ